MSDIQRFRVYDDDEVLPVENGEWVAYADHVAALAQAERRGRNAAWADEASTYREHYDDGYEQGQRDERARWFRVDDQGKPGSGMAGYLVGYEDGQRDALAAMTDDVIRQRTLDEAVQRVEAMHMDLTVTGWIIAVIKGES